MIVLLHDSKEGNLTVGNDLNLFARSRKYYRHSNIKSTERNSYQVCDFVMQFKKR